MPITETLSINVINILINLVNATVTLSNVLFRQEQADIGKVRDRNTKQVD